MKSKAEIPDDGGSLKNGTQAPRIAPLWMSAFGGLRALHKETEKINRVLEQESGLIEEGEWRCRRR
jgi:hypothetical protein